MDKDQQKKLLTEIMEADEKDGLYNTGKRVKLTYVGVHEGKPIVSAGSFEDLRKGLDEYYGVDRTDAQCLGFIPYYSKYPDEYEGHYSYSYTMILRDVKHTEIDVVKVYCIDYYPTTHYEN